MLWIFITNPRLPAVGPFSIRGLRPPETPKEAFRVAKKVWDEMRIPDRPLLAETQAVWVGLSSDGDRKLLPFGLVEKWWTAWRDYGGSIKRPQ